MTTTRAALPTEAMRITPSYSWRLDLDIKFSGDRPNDWPNWSVRMHVWSDDFGFSLRPGSGVSFETVDLASDGEFVIPVIRLTPEQTEAMRGLSGLRYLIDLSEPGGDPEDYFTGPLPVVPGPPRSLLIP